MLTFYGELFTRREDLRGRGDVDEEELVAEPGSAQSEEERGKMSSSRQSGFRESQNELTLEASLDKGACGSTD